MGRGNARCSGYVFPYLYDESQERPRPIELRALPIFSSSIEISGWFIGAKMDDSRPGNSKPNDGADLCAALDAVLAGQAPSTKQKPSMGYSIKWKAGKAPAYG